jgi:hypothetical protein
MGQASTGQDGRDDRTAEAERTAREHEANVNQLRDEPMPAGHHDDRDQAAVTQNEEHAAASAPGGRRDQTARQQTEWHDGDGDRAAPDSGRRDAETEDAGEDV